MRKENLINRFFKFVIPVLLFALKTEAQELRTSLLQFPLNALPLNPAYTGSVGTTSFEATYFGNFVSGNLLSRSVLASLHGRAGAADKTAWGGLMQFYQVANFRELNIRPSFAYLTDAGTGTVAFGAALGIGWFDFEEDVFFSEPGSFPTLDGGLGVYYFAERYFVGASVLSIFEKGFVKKDEFTPVVLRENPYHLAAGFIKRLNDQIQLKPTALLKFSNFYRFPEKSPATEDLTAWSVDFQATIVVDESYWVGLLYGFTDPSAGSKTNRLSVSVTYTYDRFHLTYGVQRNSRRDNLVELPVSHLISAGYDFFPGVEEMPVRYF
jgi:hypothetical protein